jgi:GxxExxY protein
MKEITFRKLGIEGLVPIPLMYKGEILNKEYIIDLLVEKEIILELKALEVILPVHEAQIISYLKLANKRLGFLINFNVPLLKMVSNVLLIISNLKLSASGSLR